MRTPDRCFIDELEVDDWIYDPHTDDAVQIVDVALRRAPSGQCVWSLETTGSVIRYEVLVQATRLSVVEQVAA